MAMNPFDWQRLAAQQDPGTYGWRPTASASQLSPTQLAEYEPALRQAGLWNDAWQTAVNQGGFDANGAPQEFSNYTENDLSNLAGYNLGEARSEGRNQLRGLLDPGGNVVDGSQSSFVGGGSMHRDDWAKVAMAMAAGLGPVGAAALGPAGAGFSAAQAAGMSGAGVGGALGGIKDGWEGALKGAAIGGLGGYAGGSLGEMFGGGGAGATGAGGAQGGINAGLDPSFYMPGEFGDPLAIGQGFDPSMGQFSAPAMGGAPSPDIVGDTVQVTGQRPAGVDWSMGGVDPSLPQFMPESGQFGEPLSLTDPYAAFDTSMSRFLPAAALPGGGGSPKIDAGLDPSFQSPGQKLGDPLTLGGLGGAAAGAGGLNGLLDLAKVALPIAGAVAGAREQGGETSTQQSKTDPRIDPYIYQQFLPAWGRAFEENKSGVNDTMRAGWNQQLGLLNDPQIAQQLTGMRNNSLLSQSVATNPFASGWMQLPNGGQGLLSGMQTPRNPNRRFTG